MTKTASLDPNAGRIIIYVNKFGIMKNLLNYENSLPDSTLSGIEGLSRLEIHLSEKRSGRNFGCLKLIFVPIWSILFPFYAKTRRFLIDCDIVARNRP